MGTFEDETFAGIDLDHADLVEKTFYRCTFRDAKLQESRWARARLEDCVFEGCDLTRMQPKHMAALGVAFRGCKLLGVAWEGLSVHPELSFTDCDLRYASFVDLALRKTAFSTCGLIESSFLGVDLSEADFTGSDLTGALFERSDLRKTNFSHARAALIDPVKNRAKGARVSLEGAALLAMSLGLRVSDLGVSDDAPRRAPRARKA